MMEHWEEEDWERLFRKEGDFSQMAPEFRARLKEQFLRKAEESGSIVALFDEELEELNAAGAPWMWRLDDK